MYTKRHHLACCDIAREPAHVYLISNHETALFFLSFFFSFFFFNMIVISVLKSFLPKNTESNEGFHPKITACDSEISCEVVRVTSLDFVSPLAM